MKKVLFLFVAAALAVFYMSADQTSLPAFSILLVLLVVLVGGGGMFIGLANLLGRNPFLGPSPPPK